MSDVPQHEPQWVDTAISRLLRIGVMTSMSIVLAGLALTFIHHPQYVRSKSALGGLTDAEAIYPHRLSEVIAQVREGRGQAIVMLGLCARARSALRRPHAGCPRPAAGFVRDRRRGLKSSYAVTRRRIMKNRAL
jgi:hypothetical protein